MELFLTILMILQMEYSVMFALLRISSLLMQSNVCLTVQLSTQPMPPLQSDRMGNVRHAQQIVSSAALANASLVKALMSCTRVLACQNVLMATLAN